jgi:hypothetical protein
MTLREGLTTLLATIQRELGSECPLREPCGDAAACPLPLQAFYRESDGLVLPFLRLWRRVEFQTQGVPGWIIFGDDCFSSFCLCRLHAGDEPPLTLWDHESGEAPERCYENVIELIETGYKEYLAGGGPAQVVVATLPPGAPLAPIVASLKHVSPLSSAELLSHLRRLPAAIPCADRASGIRVVRELQSRGAGSFLRT